MRTGLTVTACAILIGQFIAISSPEAASASGTKKCAENSRIAVAAARSALEKSDTSNDRAALSCLVEAVAALDERVRGLSDGSVPFDGQIYAPKGIVMTKPPVQGGR